MDRHAIDELCCLRIEAVPQAMPTARLEQLDELGSKRTWDDGEHFHRWLAALAGLVAEACVDLDAAALAATQTQLRLSYAAVREDAALVPNDAASRLGGLRAVAEVVRGALERAAPIRAARLIEPGGLAARFLAAVASEPGSSNRDLADRLGESRPVDEGQLSRLGRQLLGQGLVVRRRAGRQNSWGITPSGRQALSELKARQTSLTDSRLVLMAASALGAAGIAEPIRQYGAPGRVEMVTRQGRVAYERPTESLGTVASAPPSPPLELEHMTPAEAPPLLAVGGVEYQRVSTG